MGFKIKSLRSDDLGGSMVSSKPIICDIVCIRICECIINDRISVINDAHFILTLYL